MQYHRNESTKSSTPLTERRLDDAVFHSSEEKHAKRDYILNISNGEIDTSFFVYPLKITIKETKEYTGHRYG